MGPSGQGKTTLLLLLAGLLQKDAGEIEGLEGETISMVFQEERLCENLSAAANVRFVSGSDLSLHRLLSAFTILGIEDCIQQPIRELSGGQRQRVALVRALLAPFDILLLDEPFQGLDQTSRQQAAQWLREMTLGKTVIMVTHDPQEVELLEGTIVTLPT